MQLDHPRKRLLEERFVVDAPIAARITPLEPRVSNQLLEARLPHELVLQHEPQGRRLNVRRRISFIAQNARKAPAGRTIDLFGHLGLVGEELRIVPAQDAVLAAVRLPLVRDYVREKNVMLGELVELWHRGRTDDALGRRNRRQVGARCRFDEDEKDVGSVGERADPAFAAQIASKDFTNLGADRSRPHSGGRGQDRQIGLKRVSLSPFVLRLGHRNEHLSQHTSSQRHAPPPPPHVARRSRPRPPRDRQCGSQCNQGRMSHVEHRTADERRISKEARVAQRVE